LKYQQICKLYLDTYRTIADYFPDKSDTIYDTIGGSMPIEWRKASGNNSNKSGIGKGSWRARFVYKGKTIETKTFAKNEKKKAKDWLAECKRDMQEGRFFNTSRAEHTTLKDLLEIYIEHYSKYKSHPEKEIGTIRNVIMKHKICKLPLIDIQTAHIDGFIKDMLKTRSSRTVQKYFGVIRNAFNKAPKHGIKCNNPCIGAEKIKVDNEKGTRTADIDFDRLMTEVHQYNNIYLRYAVLLGIETGLRQDALLSLKWEQIDMEQGIIFFGKDAKKNHCQMSWY